MDIRIPIYVLFLVLYTIYRKNEYSKKFVCSYAKICCFILFLESGLRHANVGIDTSTYYMFFYNLKSESWTNLFSKYYDAYILGITRDPSFAIIAKPFTHISNGWQLFLIFESAIYFFALYKFLTRYIETIKGMLLAFTFCISLFHLIPLSGMRQQITMAIAMLIPALIENKKFLLFSIVILIGSTIHLSLLFVFPMYFVYHYSFSNSKSFITIALLTMPVIAFSAKNILMYIVSYSNNEYYSEYITDESSGAFMYIFFFAFIILITLHFFNFTNFKTKRMFCTALIMISFTVPLIVVDGAMIRISQYFTIYSMVFLPYIVKKTNNSLLYYGILGALLFLASKSSFEYHFFWENIAINFK